MVLGAGSIGREIARRLHAQEIHVSVVKRTPADPGVVGCDEIITTSAWREALPRTDWCFLALPLTPETRGLFDAEAIRALPRHAVLVNVGRAETVDGIALREALAEERLGGAGLDVVDPAPPGPSDPLWTSPRCILTPHVAAHDPDRLEVIERFFEAQVAAWLRGGPLTDEVPLGAK
jgi:phosphoglycerate dehydrogenase-like enzyme